MKLGIVGLPNVGKSTLFNSITKAGAECANYPFCTIEPNVGVVPIPDKRLQLLTQLYNSEKTTYATIEFVDIAGLVKGAAKGEGLGNQFLANIRETDAIVHVVRCFDDSNIIHVDGSIDPIRDIEVINMELIFADLETLEKRLSKVKHQMNNDKEAKVEFDVLDALKKHLEAGQLAINFEVSDDDRKFVDSLNLLTAKKVIYALNVGEEDIKDDGANNDYVKKARTYAATHNSEAFVISAKVEEDLAGLEDSEKEEFLKELGIKESGLDKLIKASYKLLNLMSFLTAGEKETRAWTIEIGTKAPKAAGKIHTDFEKGFIKAEVINYKELLDAGSLAKAKEKGLVRVEGKDYVVQDGDVMLFRFNV